MDVMEILHCGIYPSGNLLLHMLIRVLVMIGAFGWNNHCFCIVRNTIIPTQRLVRSPKANNNIVQLFHDTSILDNKLKIVEENSHLIKDGLQLYSLESEKKKASGICGFKL